MDFVPHYVYSHKVFVDEIALRNILIADDQLKPRSSAALV